MIKDPTDGIFVVKRIVALPGETVSFLDGKVYVNNRRLDEPYLFGKDLTLAVQEVKEPIACGRNQYFVLGDNRGDSFDSRNYGPVRRDRILGLVMR